MIKALCGFILFAASATGVSAEILLVRSGEHADFSRLVVDPEPDVAWRFGRTEDGYELVIEQNDLTFDISGVFRLIPRDRVIAVQGGVDQSTLAVTVRDNAHAVAFETEAGALVIDVRDGPAPDTSPFERSLQDNEIVEAISASPDPGQVTASTAPKTQSIKSYRRPVRHDPNLPVYWNIPDPTPKPEIERPVVAPQFPPQPSQRVADAEALLLQQLGRAASQGLIEPNPPSLSKPNPSEHSPTEIAAEDPPPAETNAAREQNVRAETSIDRDGQFDAPQVSSTSDGFVCLSDDKLALSNWADERPFPNQLSEARSSLLGEFDEPSPQAVTDLARLYLHFGFGAEARVILATFGPDIPDAQLLSDLASIVDGADLGQSNSFDMMQDCDTAAALWGVLAQPNLSTSDTINYRAVTRAFSGLPLHMRRDLGPKLSERFLDIDATDAAQAIRDAIARAPGGEGSGLEMINGQLDLASGDAQSAERRFDKVIVDNGPMSPQAVVMAVQSRLDRDSPIEPKLLETAGAMAFEHRGTEHGGQLERAYILSLASNGAFAPAFEAMRRWQDDDQDPLQTTTLHELFGRLAQPEAEPVFLQSYFAHREMLDLNSAPAALRHTLAKPLLREGFSDEVRRLVGTAAKKTPSERLMLARADMLDFDADGALKLLENTSGDEALKLRAEAQQMLGQHQDAVETLLLAEANVPAGMEAWRAGNWTVAARLGDDARRTALTELGMVEETEAETPSADMDAQPSPTNSLRHAQSLLEDSQATRTTLANILTDLAPLDDDN